jgi:HK97 family phage portal protein
MLDWIKRLFPITTRSGKLSRPWTAGPLRQILPGTSGRGPTPRELLNELRTTAYACASINAGACATFVPRLYVRLDQSNPKAPKGFTHPLGKRIDPKNLCVPSQPGAVIHEITDHPILNLLRSVNDHMNGTDLLELTALSMEVLGNAFWWLEGEGKAKIPESIWPLPAQRMRHAGGADAGSWIFDSASGPVLLEGDRVIHFRVPSLEDIYGLGSGPMRAAYEPATLASRFHAFRRGLWENAAVPGVVLSSSQPLPEEEVARIESRWQQRFGKGGSGRVLVTDNDFKVSTIQYSPADLAHLAEAGATRDEIANAFGVPLAYLTKESNLANLQAARVQHLSLTILPRLRRRDDRINECLVRRFDPTGRLFLASDHPVPEDRELLLRQQETDLRLGVVTINEVRQSRGLPPVSWGNGPHRAASPPQSNQASVLPRSLRRRGK